MPTCNKCGAKWSYRKTLIKMMFTFGTVKKCPYCNKRQHINAATRKRTGKVSSFVVIPLLSLPAFLNLSLKIIIIGSLIISLLFFMLLPFIIELSNQEESDW
ncbi:TIGR04104 family putative zinc finger protein [Halobacillus andaensis]|uniref:TIGR04104 family putative zinc finger protein n=1 Tax=Halobacillus andaensis TaxID=1176239 RepID=UPI001668E63A|nr:CXXC-20-CXXC protein [Halobacillus andaensis]